MFTEAKIHSRTFYANKFINAYRFPYKTCSFSLMQSNHSQHALSFNIKYNSSE